MPERAKVIESLNKALTRVGYGDMDNVTLSEVEEAIESAITLLREQEPVRPETVVRTGIGEEQTIQALICGNCHKIMSYGVMYNFCPWCGKAVKWHG